MTAIFNGRRVPADIIAALQTGRLIEAIKSWRAFSGEDLRTSKDFIEAIRPQVLGTTQAPASAPLPSKELPKHELLLKLLKMTASDNDAEALVAVRKANALLTSAGWDWDRLLAGKITVVGDPFGNLHRPADRSMSPQDYAQQARGMTQPPRPTPRPAPQPQRAAQPAPPGTAYYQAPRRAGRSKINYDDIFNDASVFGRGS